MWYFNSWAVTAPLLSHSSHLPHRLCHSLGGKYRSAGVGGSSPFMTANERETHSGAAFYFDMRKTGLMLSISHWCLLYFGPSGQMHLVSAPASHNLMHRLIRLPLVQDTTGEPLWKSRSRRGPWMALPSEKWPRGFFKKRKHFWEHFQKGRLNNWARIKKAPIYVHPPFWPYIVVDTAVHFQRTVPVCRINYG